MTTKKEPTGITKKEFVAKILERGKGRPIDLSFMHTEKTYNNWIYNDDILHYFSDEFQIGIMGVDKNNPPTDEEKISFLTRDKLDFVNEIPTPLADHIIKKLCDIPTKQERESVVLPHSLKQALHSFQQDEQRVEWGGGVDFEIIDNQPRVERILTYYGEKGKVPSRIIRKYGNDVEVQFHTHPNCKFAEPSDNDINQFINIEQRVCFIIADDEILVLEKTRNTPKSTNIDEVKSECPSTHYQGTNKSEQTKALNEIEKKFAIRTATIPRKADLVFDLNIIRNLQ